MVVATDPAGVSRRRGQARDAVEPVDVLERGAGSGATRPQPGVCWSPRWILPVGVLGWTARSQCGSSGRVRDSCCGWVHAKGRRELRRFLRRYGLTFGSSSEEPRAALVHQGLGVVNSTKSAQKSRVELRSLFPVDGRTIRKESGTTLSSLGSPGVPL